MKRMIVTAITALVLSACVGAPDASQPRTAMGSGMSGGMMRGQEGGKSGNMSDMCAKMMAEHGAANDEKKAAMMDRMKGCKVMPNAGEEKSDLPQSSASDAAAPNDHSEHHPPQ